MKTINSLVMLSTGSSGGQADKLDGGSTPSMVTVGSNPTPVLNVTKQRGIR